MRNRTALARLRTTCEKIKRSVVIFDHYLRRLKLDPQLGAEMKCSKNGRIWATILSLNTIAIAGKKGIALAV